MRKITTEAVEAFNNMQPFKKQNTAVRLYNVTSDNPEQLPPAPHVAVLELHGNIIAEKNTISNTLLITTAGWNTVTTRERLNGIPGVHVQQKNGELFLNGKPWDGTCVNITEHQQQQQQQQQYASF